MSQIARRRTDELGDFVAVLELCAVNLDESAWIPEQNLRSGFHDSRFTRAGRSQKQQIADGPAGRRHSGQIGLVNVYDLLNAPLLADDFAPESPLEVEYVRASHFGVEQNFLGHVGFNHCCAPLHYLWRYSGDIDRLAPDRST